MRLRVARCARPQPVSSQACSAVAGNRAFKKKMPAARYARGFRSARRRKAGNNANGVILRALCVASRWQEYGVRDMSSRLPPRAAVRVVHASACPSFFPSLSFFCRRAGRYNWRGQQTGSV